MFSQNAHGFSRVALPDGGAKMVDSARFTKPVICFQGCDRVTEGAPCRGGCVHDVRKNGTGFFRYEKGKKAGVDETVYGLLGVTRGAGPGDEAITERLSLAMLNEAVRALEEGVIRQPRDGDIGAIFGIGYPPFRGGPFRTLDAMGPAKALDALERLQAKFGPRFAPAAMLTDVARRGGRFHPER